MISIVITSLKEPKTIGCAIEQASSQSLVNYEIIVCAPDKETLAVAKKYCKHNHRIKLFKDPGKGKPSALNLVIPKCLGNIIVLTDGDVFMKNNILKNMLKLFKDPKVGAVTGHPVSTLSRKFLLGFWAEVLCSSFHHLRMQNISKGKPIVCSGYLYAIRKKLFKPLPSETLADDAFISFNIQSQKYQVVYAAEAEVYVKYPLTFADWVRQKKRTAGRVYQLYQQFDFSQSTSLAEEIRSSLFGAKCITSLKEAIWFFMLLGMKTYVWARTLFDFRLKKRSLNQTWQRVKSTK
jgi:cellulose synthase/poly-beta-1,6-N-acetylglucosamine synthase-like glycosyltransferase